EAVRGARQDPRSRPVLAHAERDADLRVRAALHRHDEPGRCHRVLLVRGERGRALEALPAERRNVLEERIPCVYRGRLAPGGILPRGRPRAAPRDRERNGSRNEQAERSAPPRRVPHPGLLGSGSRSLTPGRSRSGRVARASVRCQAAVGNATTRRLRGGRRRSTALTRTARTARGSWAPSEVPSPCLGRGTGAHPCSPGRGATHRVAYASGTDPPAHAPEGAPRTSPHGRRSCAAYRDATPTTCATPTTRLHPSAPLPAARRRRSQQRRIVAFPRVTRPARGVSDRAALRVLPA